MAIRNIRLDADPILRKKSRPIDKVDDKIKILAEDMLETMYHAEGVGLAAPQVGILKRLVVIDVGEGPVVIVNPQIIHDEGQQQVVEGCLSIPGKSGVVDRPKKVIVKGIDIEGQEVQHEAEGFLAQAFCHEIDHLDGILFTDKVIRYIDK
ncbi:peptide deformylase [Irregularibacter muris]|uniref:Peptide deformylase n=1 Tax=Irregularibacter muris TaxID=1796619 RepID=A0AAE3L3F4_9FIRM|nr:peptide deformylase [Irregularibacter muris]MCR1898173.1 peptide deformylase [Irregularibacter muris]